MPKLDWIGKGAVENHYNQIPFKFLKNKSGSMYENLIIQGDNLEALKSLMPKYKGRIKCIYIDPPYNTGNEEWTYNDNVNSVTIKRWLGKVVGKIGEDLTRHDKWLCMMYPRLKLLRELLHNEGAIFVHISDIEEHHLRIMLDELFDEKNFVNRITIKTRSPSGFQSVNSGVFETAEYIFIYAKNKKNWKYQKQFVESGYDSNYNKLVTNKQDPVGDWKIKPVVSLVANQLGYSSKRDALQHIHSCIFDESVEQFALSHADSVFRYTAISDQGAAKETVRLKHKSKTTDQILIQKRTSFGDRFIHNGQEMSFYSKKIRNIDGVNVSSTQLTNIWTDISWEGIAKEGSVKLKKGKKPVKLLKRIIKMATEADDIVLDSFAGSGTTGEAVLQVNKEDGGTRKFILVELEPEIAKNSTAKRISAKIESLGGGGGVRKVQTSGFTYCTLGTTLFDENGLINPDCTYDQLASHIFLTETGRVYDERRKGKNGLIGDADGVEIYLIYDNRQKRNTLDFKTLKEFPKETEKTIYADSCTISSKKLTQWNVVFKQIPYEVEV